MAQAAFAAAAAITAPTILGDAGLPAEPPLPTLRSYKHITFVDESASKRFKCAICTSVAFAPPNQECGHLHCRSCLEQARKRKKECPQCRAPVSSRCLEQPNGFVQREILQLHVKCMQAGRGCEWSGTMGADHRNLREHYAVCGYHKARCQACEQDVLRKDVPQHPQQCPARLIRCDHCQERMSHRKYVTHRAPFAADLGPCSGSRFCPNGCSADDGSPKSVRLNHVSAHLLECPLRRVNCPCCMPAVMVLPADLREHVQQQLADAGRHAAMAQLIVRLSQQGQQRSAALEAEVVDSKKRKQHAFAAASSQGEPAAKRRNAAACSSSAAAASAGLDGSSAAPAASASALHGAFMTAQRAVASGDEYAVLAWRAGLKAGYLCDCLHLMNQHYMLAEVRKTNGIHVLIHYIDWPETVSESRILQCRSVLSAAAC